MGADAMEFNLTVNSVKMKFGAAIRSRLQSIFRAIFPIHISTRDCLGKNFTNGNENDIGKFISSISFELSEYTKIMIVNVMGH